MRAFTRAVLLLFILALVKVEAKSRKQFPTNAENVAVVLAPSERIFIPQPPSNNNNNKGGPSCVIARNRRSYVVRSDEDDAEFRQTTASPAAPTTTTPYSQPALPTYWAPPATTTTGAGGTGGSNVNCIIVARPPPPPSFLFSKPRARIHNDSATPLRSGQVVHRRRKKTQETRRKLSKRFKAQMPKH